MVLQYINFLNSPFCNHFFPKRTQHFSLQCLKRISELVHTPGLQNILSVYMIKAMSVIFSLSHLLVVLMNTFCDCEPEN